MLNVWPFAVMVDPSGKPAKIPFTGAVLAMREICVPTGKMEAGVDVQGRVREGSRSVNNGDLRTAEHGRRAAQIDIQVPPAAKVNTPVSNIAGPESPRVRVPLSLSEPISPVPAKEAPFATVTAVLGAVPATIKVPALTLVPPVYVFTPASVNVPVPAFTIFPVPVNWLEDSRYCYPYPPSG